ncbi:MAG: DUF3782 domain-containing protein [Armatimonadota bacterium]|nr:DUF3782 domain-containing protein [Armatimonadota bacterium]MDW8142895.1 DUF3782 domain-containing protein [Armatimonadota bacterium]
MSEQEILEIIRQHLPKLMQENPQVREWIRELVAQYGVTREEWVAFLDRFDRLIEAVERNTEQISRLWEAVHENTEQISRLWEAIRENTEQISRLWEAVSRLQEAVHENTEQISRLWEAVRENTEQISRLWQAVDALREEMRSGFERIHRRITSLGARWGLESERAFRAGLKGILEQRFEATVTQWRRYDEQGFVIGVPSWVEADVLIHNDEHLLIEIKAHVSRGDISEFRRLGQFYEQVTGVKPRLIIISPSVDEHAADLAQLWGIAVYGEPEDVPTKRHDDDG